MKIAALTSGKHTPSTRFRIRQHGNNLQESGITVREYIPFIDKYAGIPSVIGDRVPENLMPQTDWIWRTMKLTARFPGLIGSWQNDVTWLGRELLPGRLTLESLLKHPLVFDVDDAIWHAKPFGEKAAAKIAEISDITIVGNNFLANWFNQHTNNIRIVPTAVDTTHYRPRSDSSNSAENRFVVGWTGISGNFPYLYAIEHGLERFLAKYDAQLLVVADAPPKFTLVKPEMVKFVRWSPGIEAKIIQEMHVGLMPLPSSDWARGKCSLKMLIYMACGLPVVVSPVGTNAEILAMNEVGIGAESNDDYYDALERLYLDRQLGKRLGNNGRKITEKNFSRAIISKTLVEIFSELA